MNSFTVYKGVFVAFNVYKGVFVAFNVYKEVFVFVLFVNLYLTVMDKDNDIVYKMIVSYDLPVSLCHKTVVRL